MFICRSKTPRQAFLLIILICFSSADARHISSGSEIGSKDLIKQILHTAVRIFQQPSRNARWSLFCENHALLQDKHGRYAARRACVSWQPAPPTAPLARPDRPVPGISANGSWIRSMWKIGDRSRYSSAASGSGPMSRIQVMRFKLMRVCCQRK